MRNNNRPSRAKQRRADADTTIPARPGAEQHKALGKSLGPKAQAALKQAQQLGKAGDHSGAAKIYRELGEHLSTDGKPGLAARAYLRAARSLHHAGNDEGRGKAIQMAVEQAKASPNKKAVVTHFRDLVRRLRQGGNEELADSVQSQIMEGMDRTKLGRKGSEGQPRVGGGRRRRS